MRYKMQRQETETRNLPVIIHIFDIYIYTQHNDKDKFEPNAYYYILFP